MSMNKKIKGLLILAKDVDAYLANYMVENKDCDFDLVVWRHRDMVEFKSRFPQLANIYSLPQFFAEKAGEYESLSVGELAARITQYEKQYSLRGANRYIHYDFFRARNIDDTHRENLIRNLVIIEFFVQLDISQYDFLLGELSRSSNLIAYDLAGHFGVEYLHPVSLGFFDGIAFTDDVFHIPYLEQRASRLLSNRDVFADKLGEAEMFLRNFREKPAYNKAFLFGKMRYIGRQLSNLAGKISNLPCEIKAVKYDRKYSLGYVYKNPVMRFLRSILIDPVKAKIHGLLIVDESAGLSDFVYYPLHYHPETTTSLYSERTIENYVAQRSVVEFASKFLPTGVELAVKEHPYMVGNRPLRFYSEIRDIYNAKLVHPSKNQFELIKNSRCILTHCGTVGLESICLGKSVIVMESVYYDFMDGVVRMSSISGLSDEIGKANGTAIDERRLINGLALLESTVYHGIKNFIQDHDKSVISAGNLEAFSNAITSEIKFRKMAPELSRVSLSKFLDFRPL